MLHQTTQLFYLNKQNKTNGLIFWFSSLMRQYTDRKKQTCHDISSVQFMIDFYPGICFGLMAENKYSYCFTYRNIFHLDLFIYCYILLG